MSLSSKAEVDTTPSFPSSTKSPPSSTTPTTPDHPESSEIPSELIHYITALDESYDSYERFFDALLIKRSRHAAFFRDLRSFRSQPHIIQLLASPFPADEKPNYREVSAQYLTSRYAHPWCRTSAFKEGWFKAEWGSIRKAPTGYDKEEQRLHGLLVPIWCRFRLKMMPSEEVMARFVEWEKEKAAAAREKKKMASGEAKKVQWWLDDVNGKTVETKDGARVERERETSQEPEWDDDEDGLPRRRSVASPADAQSAANMFVGLATAGMLLENKRARKYLLKKFSKAPKR